MPRRRKPIPPIERFPTVPRRDGRFQKRIHGRLYYFGRAGDRALALAEYDRVKHALYEGRAVAAASADTSLRQLAYRMLDEKLADAKAGRITLGTYHDYVGALKRLEKFFGRARLIADLGPDDFSAFARHLRKRLGPFAYNRERACVVAMFNHATAADWIERPVKIGRGFPKASAAELRLNRRSQLVPIAVVQACVREAQGQLRAMTLLGVLGGYGATDCADLRWRHVDLKAALIRFARPKTMIQRETPLPIETVDALRAVRDERPRDELVFRTRHGNPWVRQVGSTHHDAVGWAWVKLQRGLDLPTRYPFYALRHTFATHANAAGDRDAVRRIMGHKLSGLDDFYVEALFVPRLRRVVDHVRSLLLPAPEMVYA